MSSETVITFLASFLIWFMFAAVLVLWIVKRDLKTSQVLHVFATVFVVFIVTDLIKGLIPTPRPFLENGIEPLTVTVPLGSSFPSTHAGTAFALTFGLFNHNKKLGLAFFPPALLVGIGRVTSYVHSPLDIAGGIFIALIIAVFFSHQKLMRFFDRAWITS